MTYLPSHSVFQNTFPTSTLVLVDMCKANLPRGLKRSPAGTVLQNCRRALSIARLHGWRVAHVRSEDALMPGSDRSIAGFEPERIDPKFERRTPSCYSSPYFQSVMRETAGSFVLAGFLGDGGALATIADSILFGDHVTLLGDASLDDVSYRVFTDQVMTLLASHTSLGFNVVSTSLWLRTIEVLSVLPPVRLAKAPNPARRRSANGNARS